MKTRKLMSKLYRIFPRTLAESWDHVGLMIGPVKEETNVVALCLDLDAESLAKAIDGGADMVISHHPVFFGRKKDVLLANAERLNVFEKATEAGIMAYSFHTNFDAKFPEGMNEALAEKLGLSEIHPLVSEPMAVGGELPAPMEVHDFARFARQALSSPYGLLINRGKKEIKSVAILGGGGSSSWREAMLEGYDIYISGDAPHHTRRDIVNAGANYLDLPHEIESIFVERMTEILLNINQELTIVPIVHEIPPEIVL